MNPQQTGCRSIRNKQNLGSRSPTMPNESEELGFSKGDVEEEEPPRRYGFMDIDGRKSVMPGLLTLDVVNEKIKHFGRKADAKAPGSRSPTMLNESEELGFSKGDVEEEEPPRKYGFMDIDGRKSVMPGLLTLDVVNEKIKHFGRKTDAKAPESRPQMMPNKSEELGFSNGEVEEEEPPRRYGFMDIDGRKSVMPGLLTQDVVNKKIKHFGIKADAKAPEAQGPQTKMAKPLEEHHLPDSYVKKTMSTEERGRGFEDYGTLTGEIEYGIPVEPSLTLDFSERKNKNYGSKAQAKAPGTPLPKLSRNNKSEVQSMPVISENFLEEQLLKEILADIDSHRSEDYLLNEYETRNLSKKSQENLRVNRKSGEKHRLPESPEAPPPKQPKSGRNDFLDGEMENKIAKEGKMDGISGRITDEAERSDEGDGAKNDSFFLFVLNERESIQESQKETPEGNIPPSKEDQKSLENVSFIVSPRNAPTSPQKVARRPKSANSTNQNEFKYSTRYTESRPYKRIVTPNPASDSKVIQFVLQKYQSDGPFHISSLNFWSDYNQTTVKRTPKGWKEHFHYKLYPRLHKQQLPKEIMMGLLKKIKKPVPDLVKAELEERFRVELYLDPKKRIVFWEDKQDDMNQRGNMDTHG